MLFYKKFTFKTVLILLPTLLLSLFLIAKLPKDYILSYLVYPFVIAENSIVKPIKIWFSKRNGIEQLHKIAKKIAIERDELLEKNIELKAVLNYFDECYELIEFRKKYNKKKYLIARILIKNFSEKSHIFWIDAGKNKGIKVGMVATYKNCLLGRVIEVFPAYSKVLAITDSSCHVSVKCSATAARGIHEGCNNVKYSLMKFVNHLDEIKEGDILLSHGGSLIFPPGFAIGKILESNNIGVYKEVIVRPMFDIKDIELCTII